MLTAVTHNFQIRGSPRILNLRAKRNRGNLEITKSEDAELRFGFERGELRKGGETGTGRSLTSEGK